MKRTFQHRLTWTSWLTLAMLSGLVLAVLWHPSGANALIGAGLLVLTVVVVERMIHTSYTLTADNRLVISRGRFSKTQAIAVENITRVTRIKPAAWLPAYVLVEHGAENHVALLPADERLFIRELNKRMKS